MFLLQLIVLIYSVVLHEVAHGWLADKLGDPTARLSGRLTLDPRPHIDPVMTILLPLLLLLAGGPVFGAARPVPIDPFNFRDKKKDIALTAAAGPVTNLLIALLFSFILRLSSALIINDSLQSLVLQLSLFIIQANVFLAVFNLLPIPPLDGFKVAGGLLPDDLVAGWYSLERYGVILIFVILFFFSTLVNAIILPVSHTLLRFLLP